MDTPKAQPIIESLLEEILFVSNRLNSLSDRLDVKLNWQSPKADWDSNLNWPQWIIDKLCEIKKQLFNTEKSLEEQIDKI